MVLGTPIAYATVLAPITGLLAGFMLLWFVLGVRCYGTPPRETVVGIALVPITSLLHSLGTILGLVFPPDDFRVTKKVHSKTDTGTTRSSPAEPSD